MSVNIYVLNVLADFDVVFCKRFVPTTLGSFYVKYLLIEYDGMQIDSKILIEICQKHF